MNWMALMTAFACGLGVANTGYRLALGKPWKFDAAVTALSAVLAVVFALR